jgi:hypothetical protein
MFILYVVLNNNINCRYKKEVGKEREGKRKRESDRDREREILGF